MRTLIISDIHGLYSELLRAMDCAGCRASDRLIFLGDYGLYYNAPRNVTLKVLDYLVGLSRDEQNIFLRGNHEKMFLSQLEGDERFKGASREDFLKQMRPEHIEFIKNTRSEHAEEGLLCIHDADELSGRTAETRPDTLVVSGHLHGPDPILKHKRIVIGSNNKVFVLDLDTMKIYDSDGNEYDAAKAKS